MIKCDSEVKFSQVKKGQLFQYGLKSNEGVWVGLSTYRKTSRNTGSPVWGEVHQVYGFAANNVVLVES